MRQAREDSVVCGLSQQTVPVGLHPIWEVHCWREYDPFQGQACIPPVPASEANLGIAKKSCDVFKEYDTEKEAKSDTFRREGSAVHFVYAMTKIRYKQGKEDPVGFNQQFMRQENHKAGNNCQVCL